MQISNTNVRKQRIKGHITRHKYRIKTFLQTSLNLMAYEQIFWEGGITPTAVRRQGGGNNVDTKSWELFPWFKIFFCCNLIWEGPKFPTLKLLPSHHLREARGVARTPKVHFLTFFFTKLDPEPELGVLKGRAGSPKIGDNLPHHPKKIAAKNMQPFRRYSVSMLFPFSLSAIFPF